MFRFESVSQAAVTDESLLRPCGLSRRHGHTWQNSENAIFQVTKQGAEALWAVKTRQIGPA